MPDGELTISPCEFVVRIVAPESREAARKRLAEWGLTRLLPGHADVLVLRIEAKPRDPRQMWDRVLRSLAGIAEVYPVYVDAEQTPRYPSGTIMARFKERPTDEALAEWARLFGLRVVQRNKYAPAQVAFAACDPASDFLPELLKRMQGQAELLAVWPETLSAYERV